MAKARTHAHARSRVSKKKSAKTSRFANWKLKHLVIAAAILVALMASIPVGAYIKASVLGSPVVAQLAK